MFTAYFNTEHQHLLSSEESTYTSCLAQHLQNPVTTLVILTERGHTRSPSQTKGLKRSKKTRILSLGNSQLILAVLIMSPPLCRGFTLHPLPLKTAADLSKSMTMPLSSFQTRKKGAWWYGYGAPQGKVSLILK